MTHDTISMSALRSVLLRVFEELLAITWNYTNRNVEIACIYLSTIKYVFRRNSSRKRALWSDSCKRLPPVSDN